MMYFIDEATWRIRVCPDAESVRRSFDRSCEICCFRGFQIRCDQCKIAYVFDQVKDCFKNPTDIKNVKAPNYGKGKCV